MSTAEMVIRIYESMSEISGQMLSAARSRDWEKLVELESRCAGHVRTLQETEGPVPLDSASRDRKVSLIHKILADDRAIRDITTPWMAELASLISSAGNERKLRRAYGA
jgi:flagellar protein FliT